MMIVKLLKRFGQPCSIRNEDLVLGHPINVALVICTDYWKVSEIYREEEYLNFENVVILSNLKIKDTNTANEIMKLSEEYDNTLERSSFLCGCYKSGKKKIQKRIESLKKQLDYVKKQGQNVLYCLIGMLKSRNNAIFHVYNKPSEYSDFITLVGPNNIGGIVYCNYDKAIEEFEQILKNLSYLQFKFHKTYDLTYEESLDIFFEVLEKTNLNKIRIDFYKLDEDKYDLIFGKLEEVMNNQNTNIEVEAVRILRSDPAEFAGCLRRLKNRNIKHVKLELFTSSLNSNSELVNGIKDGLSDIVGLEGVSFEFKIDGKDKCIGSIDCKDKCIGSDNGECIELNDVVKRLKLKYVCIVGNTDEMEKTKIFMSSIINSVDRIVLHLAMDMNYIKQFHHISKNVLSRAKGFKLAEIILTNTNYLIFVENERKSNATNENTLNATNESTLNATNGNTLNATNESTLNAAKSTKKMFLSSKEITTYETSV